MALDRYFWDTFALIERQVGSRAYAPYAEAAIVTHEMNLYEFIAYVLRDHDETTARAQVRSLGANLLDATTEDLIAAARFRAKRKVSYVDALGHTLARKNDLLFLTGDKAFRGVEGVEFVA